MAMTVYDLTNKRMAVLSGGQGGVDSNGTTFASLLMPSGIATIVTKSVTAVAITAGTPATVWTPAATKRFRLLGGAFSLSAIASFIIKDGGVATGIVSPLLAAAGVFVLPPLGTGYLSTAVNNALSLDVTATATASGFVWGYEE